MMDDQIKPVDMSRRSSLAISALLNDVAVDPCRSPVSDDPQQQPGYFNSQPNNVMFSNLPPSPGGLRREPDAIYMPEQRPTTSWDPSTYITPDGFHRRKTSKGNIIVTSIAKAKRKRISQDQFRRLMEVFEKTDTPSSEVRESLAHELGMTKREVQVWFQNRRAKMSRQRASNQKYPGMRGPLPPPPPPPPPPHPLQQSPGITFCPAPTPPPQGPLALQPIAPMPFYSTPMTINDPTSSQKKLMTPTGRHTEPGKCSYTINRHSSSIQQPIPNLPIIPDPAARKREKSAIDVLASAAEYVGTEDSKSERAPVR